MDQRHSSPSPRAPSPRPWTFRKRSNSLPIVEALGCSTPEAELILAEGRAAVNSRYAGRRRRARQDPEPYEESTRYNPRDHMKYLMGEHVAEKIRPEPVDTRAATAHLRTPSDVSDMTDRSTSTITPTTASAIPQPSATATSPLWDYSANLAKFIQSQLNSISTYSPMAYLRSGPRSAPLPSKSPPQSPGRLERPQSPKNMEKRQTLETPGVLEMPPMRPPLRSAFSAWSSTDDDTGSEASPLQTGKAATSAGSTFTPSFLKYYENTSGSSFLFTSTPVEEEQEKEEEEEKEHSNAESFSFPQENKSSAPTSELPSPDSYEADYPSSSLSRQPQLTSSSAPSISSASTASYFEFNRAVTITPQIRDRILTAVTPSHVKVIPAISPYEGGALANVHDIYIESRNRVRVDGMSFDMCPTSNMRAQC